MSGVKMEEMGPLLRRGGDALQVEGAARVGSWMVVGCWENDEEPGRTGNEPRLPSALLSAQ